MTTSGSKGRHKQRNVFVVGIVLIVFAVAGGFLAAMQSNRAAFTKTARAEAAVDANSFYEEVSITRVADVIANSDQALVYFRSPT